MGMWVILFSFMRQFLVFFVCLVLHLTRNNKSHEKAAYSTVNTSVFMQLVDVLHTALINRKYIVFTYKLSLAPYPTVSFDVSYDSVTLVKNETSSGFFNVSSLLLDVLYRLPR
jgi:hypothetical protein